MKTFVLPVGIRTMKRHGYAVGIAPGIAPVPSFSLRIPVSGACRPGYGLSSPCALVCRSPWSARPTDGTGRGSDAWARGCSPGGGARCLVATPGARPAAAEKGKMESRRSESRPPCTLWHPCNSPNFLTSFVGSKNVTGEGGGSIPNTLHIYRNT